LKRILLRAIVVAPLGMARKITKLPERAAYFAQAIEQDRIRWRPFSFEFDIALVTDQPV
jgi:hypothetical protein